MTMTQKTNRFCKEKLEELVGKYYRNNSLDTKSVLAEAERLYPKEQIEYLLAITVGSKIYDGRISRRVKDWTREKMGSIPDLLPQNLKKEEVYSLVLDSVNPGLIDLLVKRMMTEEKEGKKS